jgi:hypothetical protein
MKRRVRDVLKRQLFSLHKLGTRFGVHILPVHYYSAIPDLNKLEKSRDVWAKKSDMPGVAVDLDQQVQNLREICLPYRAEYAGNAAYNHAVENAFGPGYGYIEAQALHAVVRHYKPRRVLEVGSGVSTWCIRSALELNRAETGRDYTITCVEPYPSPALRAMDGITLIDKEVQRVPFAEGFADLAEDDLLFIDSSHAVKPGSDVNYLFLEILPRLPPGVIVHIHDINLPYDYSRMVLGTFFQWSETSLLHAYLINNDRVEIVFCQSMLHYDRQAAMREVFPEYRPQPDDDGIGPNPPLQFASDDHFPASIYLRIK